MQYAGTAVQSATATNLHCIHNQIQANEALQLLIFFRLTALALGIIAEDAKGHADLE
jgi:hypothetical protein